MKRQFAIAAFEAADLLEGRVEPRYAKVLTRLLAAHAIAEKLTAEGYARALESIGDAALRPTITRNLAEERKHARLVYQILDQLGINEAHADRSMITALKSASFAAPRRFAEHPVGPLELLMASLSLDMTGLLMVGVNYRDSSYAPHARAAEIILAEEEDHELFAATELHDAAARFGAASVNAALRDWLPCAVNFFGPPGSGFTFDCLRYGLKARDNAELAELYLTMLERRVLQAGLAMPRLTPDYPHAIA
ncbi:MAG: phenylacetate-CoA oxygenase subunit PaaI [Candidatus Binataceae bacterium]|nr:phenylacetate-CoA oxygenase subunit PaaI [Candidatus Binataceae bacterium]